MSGAREAGRGPMPERVLVIDDHPIVLQGCRRVLRDAGVVEVLEAGSLVAGYRLYRRHRPGMLITDLAMQGNGLGGLMLIRRLRLQDARMPILVFSMHADPVIVARALEAGANGYLMKDTDPEALAEACERVGRGEPYLDHQVAVQVAMLARGGRGAAAELTRRELQVLSLLAEGRAYGQIAADLGVSYKTVVNTCSQLKGKLGARTLPELIRRAVQFIAASPA